MALLLSLEPFWTLYSKLFLNEYGHRLPSLAYFLNLNSCIFGYQSFIEAICEHLSQCNVGHIKDAFIFKLLTNAQGYAVNSISMSQLLGEDYEHLFKYIPTTSFPVLSLLYLFKQLNQDPVIDWRRGLTRCSHFSNSLLPFLSHCKL